MAQTLNPRILLLLAALFYAGPANADSVQLANGEVLKGKILLIDDKQVSLESESLGKITIARSKVATITLGDAKPAPVATADPKVPVAPKPPVSSVEEAFKQLKTTGANPKDVSELQKLFPELASPEASKYFNDTLQGVASGKTSIQDIRKDAIKARDELKKLTADLGPDVGAATAPYLAVLEKFIGETKPKDEKSDPKSAAQPLKKAAPVEKK